MPRRGFIGAAAAGVGAAMAPAAAAATASEAAMARDTATPPWRTPYRVGGWLPSDHTVLNEWLRHTIAMVEAQPAPLHPLLTELQQLIETDPQVFMLFHEMFEELPKRASFNKTPTGEPQVRDYQHMLRLINAVMTTAPEYNTSGLVGFPINAILDWPMGTQSGQVAFLNPKVNAQLKKILNEWGRFLRSPDSRHVLSEDPHKGWFGRDASKAMPNFVAEFECDPSKPYHGFASWDDFFIRRFRSGQRPIASADDDAVIVSACEAAPYRLVRDVKRLDRFWIKSQPYSLAHMLADDELAEKFVGGTVYQAFLSALSYHRWNSPVSGRIVKTYLVDGSYYSEVPAMGFDPAGPNESQGYLTDVAARAIIVIEADNPAIATLCFMSVGMAEVSTCEITVEVGQHVKKGDQLGMFHFGGSTYCLIFRPQVALDFDLHGQQPGLESHNILMGARLAQVRR